MNRPKLNYIVDAISFITFLIVAISGVAIYFFMPQGVRQGGQQELLGITKNTWSEIHNILGLIFVILAIIHLILHWQWIIVMTKNIFTSKDKIEK